MGSPPRQVLPFIKVVVHAQEPTTTESSPASLRRYAVSMMKRLALIAAVALTGCAASPRKPTVIAATDTFGYTPTDPIMVGGGPTGEREYLSFLRGPNGEPVRFEREGSCCGFADKNLLCGGGLLDMYQVTCDGLEKPIVLYLDMYRRAVLMRAPKGFTFD